nr:hypothetical protein [Candidatus Ichthyocystis sparus]
MNPTTGVGGAGSSPSFDDDQADSGGLQQVQTLPGDVLVVATTVAVVSTITTTSSAVATSVSTSTVAATSVGKGSSGDRGKKGKGPDYKRCAAGSTVSTTAVHSASAGASSELAYPISSVVAEYCGFHICTSDWLDLRRMEGSFLCAVEEKATAFLRSRIQESSLLRDDSVSVIEDFSGLRDGLFSGLEADMGGFREKYFAEVHSRVIFSHHLVGGEIKKFSTEEAGRFRASFLAAIGAKIREYLALVWRLEVSMALDRALCASHSAQVAAARAAASTAASAARAAARVAARAAAPIPDTNPDPARDRARALAVVRTTNLRARRAAAACPTIDPVVARARDTARARAAEEYSQAAEEYSQAVAARAAAAQVYAAVASRFVAQARAAGSSAPNPGSNSSLVLDNLVANALTNHAAARVADARAAAAAAAAALAHVRALAPIPDTDPDPTCARNRTRNSVKAANNRARTTATLAAAARAIAVAADCAVDQARAAGSSAPNPGSGSVSDHTLDSLVAVALTHHEDARLADARARAAADAAVRAHAAVPCSNTDPNFVRARARARTADSRARTAAALAAAARAIAVAADCAVDQARAADSSALNPGSGSESDCTLDSLLVAVALTHHEGARLADARARAADAVAARAHAAVPLSNTDPNFVRAFARARAADSRAHTAAALAAAARVAAIDADRVFAQARAADGRAPDLGPDSNLVIASVGAAATAATCSVSVTSTTDTSTAAIAGSSTSSLLPDTSSPVPSGFVELFGFVVPTELSEVVSKLISEVCALAKSFYPGTLRVPFSGAVRSLSNSEQRCAWCLTNMKLYEAKFMAKCAAEYFVKLLPEFIKHLCNVRVWDSSSRCLLPLMGSRLRDFWASLDQAIFRALQDFFVAKWTALTARFSVPALLSPVPGEVSSALCGGDFVGACAKAATSSSSHSIFGSITGGMGLQVAPHAGDSVSLFGFELPSEVGEMVEVLIREISEFARRTYSSLVGVQVLDAMSRLSDSEKCAWLTASMMLYKAGFVAKCLTGYSDELCSDFIYSLFSARHGNASGRSLLSLMGNNLRDFWLSLGNAILEAVESIFVAEWGEFTRLVPLESREESSSTVCGRDFINACNKAGVPTLAISVMRRVRVAAQREVSHFAEVGSSVHTLPVSGIAPEVSLVEDHSLVSSGGVLVDKPCSPLSEEQALVVDVSTPSPSEESSMLAREEVRVSMVGTSSSAALGVLGDVSSTSPSERMVLLTTSASSVTSVEVEGSTTVTKRSYPYGSKKSFMSRWYGADVSSSSSGMSSSVPSGSIASSGTAYGEGDIGERLAELLNRGLPPSPPPASEPTPTEGKASSSSRGSGGGKRKRKKKS